MAAKKKSAPRKAAKKIGATAKACSAAIDEYARSYARASNASYSPEEFTRSEISNKDKESKLKRTRALKLCGVRSAKEIWHADTN